MPKPLVILLAFLSFTVPIGSVVVYSQVQTAVNEGASSGTLHYFYRPG